MAYLDERSDVALLQLLDDIPPEFNATLQGELVLALAAVAEGPSLQPPPAAAGCWARNPLSSTPLPASPTGWDARELGLPAQWVDISQPMGAGETITFGYGASLIAGSEFRTDGLVQFDQAACEGRGCRFVLGLPQRGTMEPGSSGSGLLDAQTRRALGVLSSGGGQPCNFDSSSPDASVNVFGRLASVSVARPLAPLSVPAGERAPAGRPLRAGSGAQLGHPPQG